MTDPIRSLHINTERTWRGGERQTLLLVAGLKDRGHPTTLVVPPGAPLGERARELGVEVVEQRMRGEIDVGAMRALRKLMRSGGYRICQMHTSHAHTLGVIARGCATWPRTIVARRVDFSIYRKGAMGMNWFKYRFGVDRYFAISEAIRRVMIRDGIPENRVVTVRSGVPPMPEPETSRAALREKYGFSDSDIVVGAAGHLAGHKGQVHLVRALGIVAKQHPEVAGLVIGEGEERELLEQETASAGLEGRIVLPGFQSDVRGHLEAFDLFAMPSLQEGLGTSVLDAMWCGLPIVASNTGGIPEAIHDEETGLLANPGDPEDIAKQITRLLEDDALRTRVATTARERARSEFTVDQTIERSIEHYRDLIARAEEGQPS